MQSLLSPEATAEPLVDLSLEPTIPRQSKPLIVSLTVVLVLVVLLFVIASQLSNPSP
jgi:hypothetical protein